MFKWLNNQGVESDRGFAVQSISRCCIEYREGSRIVSVQVEPGYTELLKSAVIISSDAFARWNGDPPNECSPEQQLQMLRNFTEAMEFQGLAVIVD